MMNRAGVPQSQQQKKKPAGNVVDNIKKLEQQREDRRKKLEEMKQAKIDRQLQNEALGKNVDADFDLLIDQHKNKVPQALNHVSSSQMNLCVCVRKRPLFDKEY
jgi:kinesin family member 2/24